MKSENDNIKYTYRMATTGKLENKKIVEFNDYMGYEKIEEAKKYVKEWENGSFPTISPAD